MRLLWRDVDGILTSLTRAETEWLRILAAGKRVLEIGSAYGYSAIAMAQVARHVVAVDPHTELPGSLEKMHQNVRSRGYADIVTLVVASSQRVLPALTEAGAHFDLVFIDGDHEEDAVRHDVTYALKLGKVIACHDYGEETCPGVQGALDGLFPAGPPKLIDTLWVRE